MGAVSRYNNNPVKCKNVTANDTVGWVSDKQSL